MILTRWQIAEWKYDIYEWLRYRERNSILRFRKAFGLMPNEITWRGLENPWDWRFNSIRIISVDTGEDVSKDVWRANQAEGWYDRYVRGQSGRYFLSSDETIITERIHQPIRFEWID